MRELFWFLPFPVKLIHTLKGLNELEDLIPLAVKDQLPEKNPTLTTHI